jgi:hypothetical protein
MDEFEQELKQALERRPAPPSLKRKVMARRARSSEPAHPFLWMRLAASIVIVLLLGGGVRWQIEKQQEKRRGEEARQQVFTALRITSQALNQVKIRLAAHDRKPEE